MYQSFGLLKSDSDFTLEECEIRLRARFPDYAITRSGVQITVAKGEWEIELGLNADATVLAESVELAEKIAGLEDGADLESCSRRVEVWSETPDPEMDHFNEFLFVVEVLQSFRGLIAVDPKEPALM